MTLHLISGTILKVLILLATKLVMSRQGLAARLSQEGSSVIVYLSTLGRGSNS